MSEIKVSQVEVLRGALRVPGDKSASHRALLISALSDGTNRIFGLSNGDDVLRTMKIVEQLGAQVLRTDEIVVVTGPKDGLRQSGDPLDCGNSGTAMRLLIGLLSGVRGNHLIVGDESLSKRPMRRVIEPLASMGAAIEAREGDHAPIRVAGGSQLTGIDYEVPTPSAQVKSAVLLAGLFATGSTVVTERIRTRANTEDMLALAGVEVESVDEGLGRRVTLKPGRPQAREWQIPGDPSQAAFFAVLGAIHPNASIGVVNVLSEAERVGYVQVLQRMGALVSIETRPSGTALRVRSSKLYATEVYSSEIPSVDEVPVLAVAAAAATGVTAFMDMGELRIKESDRFAGSMHIASALGCEVWAEGDNFFIQGLGSAELFQNFSIDAGLDHRIVMAAATAATAGNGGRINNWETVESSYPNFFQDLLSIQ